MRLQMQMNLPAAEGHDKGGQSIRSGRLGNGNRFLTAAAKQRTNQKTKRKKVIHIEVPTLPPIKITDLTNKKAQAAGKRHLPEDRTFNC